MKKTATAFLVGLFALCALALPVAQAEQLLFDYVGFDYENPNPDPTQFGEIGSGYVSLGEAPVLFAPLVFDQTLNQYTYVIHGLTAVTSTPVGPYMIVDYSPGVIELYEDSRNTGTPFNYGINPPNPTAPSTFNDGTQILVGNVTNFRFVFNSSTNSGSFEAEFEAVGGTQLGNIPVPQRRGWTFAGATSNALNIPQGYIHQIDGQVFIDNPVPARATSWGHVKASYR